MSEVRQLLLLTPDQLCLDYPALAGVDPRHDLVVQIEAAEDFTHIPSHKQRIALLLSAMRHFGDELAGAGYRHLYSALDDDNHAGSLPAELRAIVHRFRPDCLTLIRPGDWRTLGAVAAVCSDCELPLDLREDPHFLVTPADFAGWAEGRKRLVLEHFYRWLRKRSGTLMTDAGEPEGGRWNFDADNRRPFDSADPDLPQPRLFEPDPLSRRVLDLVEARFPDAPGRLDHFPWPVEREQALAALDHFIQHRLPRFGDYQDAMVKGQSWMFHSLLSPVLNLKLLDPRECIEAAVDAYRRKHAPINAVEGFVRQILGWREFIRGVYWHEGPDYAERNHLGADGNLPDFYWSGVTDMACVEDALRSVLDYGYGHHIQRLMVTGNLALMAGVDPRRLSDWYLGMYVDAMDWVTLPNTTGMVMYADGGLVGSKPYASTGKYIRRMSDYCDSCRFDPDQRTGAGACPFTTLYWHFLARHREDLQTIPRMRPMLRNLDRLDEAERQEISERADELRRQWEIV